MKYNCKAEVTLKKPKPLNLPGVWPTDEIPGPDEVKLPLEFTVEAPNDLAAQEAAELKMHKEWEFKKGSTVLAVFHGSEKALELISVIPEEDLVEE